MPISSFPFPTYYPDTGTGSYHPNRTLDSSWVQPLVKRDAQRLTLFNTGEVEPRLHQPHHEQDEYQDKYRNHQQISEREPWATIPGHTLSFRYLLPLPLDALGRGSDTEA